MRWSPRKPIRYRLPKRVTLKSGWSYITKGEGRDYVTVVDPRGVPRESFLTVKKARAFIKEQNNDLSGLSLLPPR